MTISIIIAVKTWQKNLEECVNKCSSFNDPDLEIIILPDEPIEGVDLPKSVRVIPTGNITPPLKRDVGGRAAKGEVLAFLDDDAYPDRFWLDSVKKVLKEHPECGCVCGPAVTPKSNSLRQKASGLVYSSFLVSCGQIYRYLRRGPRYVVDYPSCNLLIRKDVFDEVKGFDTKFWPGEDTYLCLKVLKLGKKKYYHPDILVYHHRRPLFKKHLHQIRSYAEHRGYFSKKFPKTSLRWDYFVPSLFALGLFLGPFLFRFQWIASAYFLVYGTYFLMCMTTSSILTAKSGERLSDKIKLWGLIFAGIVSSHIVYGIYFIKGLLASRMPEE